MKYHGPTVYPADEIITRGHWAVGTQWHVLGSRGEYTIEMVDKGFTCDCPAYKKCKHIKQIETEFLGETV